MFQKYSRCSAIFFLFFASPQAQKSCLARPPGWKAIEKVNFTDFVQRRATVNNIALLQVTRCIQLVHRQNMETLPNTFFIPA